MPRRSSAGRFSRTSCAVDEHAARGGLHHPVDGAQRGGLAAAGRADEHGDAAGGAFEADVVQGDRPARVALGHALKGDQDSVLAGAPATPMIVFGLLPTGTGRYGRRSVPACPEHRNRSLPTWKPGKVASRSGEQPNRYRWDVPHLRPCGARLPRGCDGRHGRGGRRAGPAGVGHRTGGLRGAAGVRAHHRGRRQPRSWTSSGRTPTRTASGCCAATRAAPAR